MVPTWMVPAPPTASLRWLDRGWLGAPAIRRLGRRQVVGSNWQSLTKSLAKPANRGATHAKRPADIREGLPGLAPCQSLALLVPCRLARPADVNARCLRPCSPCPPGGSHDLYSPWHR